MTVLGTMQTLLCDWNTVRERFKKHYPVICSFLILLIILCVTLGLLCGKDGADSVCLSKECVDTASRIINAMDRSANPCEDFYQYSCGNWILEHPIPKQLSRYDRNVDLTEKVFKELRKILEEEKWDGIQIPESVKKAKVLYQACLDTDALDKIGLSPIYKALKLAGLPKIPPDNQTTVNFDWMRTIVEAKRKIGLNLLVNTFISEDFRNSSVNKITVSKGKCFCGRVLQRNSCKLIFCLNFSIICLMKDF
ncbi:unnamed protein product [Brassicogethes aeneus]|uniref:Peptidase M13 N-terminal domain-containing protein n=1 Tax=Brassicogethes aeneus TaxID=1431903 RepID=A0A9P0FLR8_BRAAE|nr:unnamed protein product [Brassicogethes aeneus]